MFNLTMNPFGTGNGEYYTFTRFLVDIYFSRILLLLSDIYKQLGDVDIVIQDIPYKICLKI
jgi:hypothetical protein